MKTSKKTKQGFAKWVIFILVVSLIYVALEILTSSKRIEITFSNFLDKIVSGDIKEVNIKGNDVTGSFWSGKSFLTIIPKIYPQLVDDLRSSNVIISVSPTRYKDSVFMQSFSSWLPILVLLFIWIYYARNSQTGGKQTMKFGKSRAKLVQNKNKKITFKDVAGIKTSKYELQEIVRFLKNPKKFSKLGARIPRGCLLVGAPGTGKTLMAKAMAGEAQVPFFTISGSDFVEMFVGIGASRVRDMFAQAKKYTPCIIFIDEIDAVGRHRGTGYGGGNDEREQTLNQLLVEMDGFEENQGVIVIAATNRIDVIDSALLRSGRFDRQIYIPLPDIMDREDIIRIHIKKFIVEENLDIKLVARATSGFSGADLANLVNESALLAAKNNEKIVRISDFEEAKDKLIMGNKKILPCISEEEKKITAYHESGHAIVNFYSSYSEPVHKLTIVPRGNSMGMLVQIPDKEQYYYSRNYFETKICIAMGGRAAEEIFFGENKITTGAYSDIKTATLIARNMVTKWGFNRKIGPIMLDYSDTIRGHNNSSIISNDLIKEIDKEILNIINYCYNKAKKIIELKKHRLKKLTHLLIKKETVTGYELRNILLQK